MKKSIFNLGKKLTKKEQTTINGGTDPWCEGVSTGSWCYDKNGLLGTCNSQGKCKVFPPDNGTPVINP
ncbi:hypothetical protein ACOSP6_16580 [Tenacibaculum sp. MEBiC06402]|uniref:hypothetical protein n=1 Tax=unclassified Tenacibaculum TaxID=2635139 RepID=UPI003B9C0C68